MDQRIVQQSEDLISQLMRSIPRDVHSSGAEAQFRLAADLAAQLRDAALKGASIAKTRAPKLSQRFLHLVR